MRTKLNFIQTVERSIRDDAQKFTKSVITSAESFGGGITAFTVDSVLGFHAGELVVLYDGTTTKFLPILSIDEVNTKINFTGDQTAFQLGTVIKKTDILQFIEQAILTFSKYREYNKTVLITNPNLHYISLPSDWIFGFSGISRIEYPTNAYYNNYLSNEDYEIIQQSDGTYRIEFGYTLHNDLYLSYTMVHTWGNQADPVSTIPDSDFNAVTDLAAAYFALALASVYAQSTDAAISADAVNYADKTSQYIRIYKEYLNKAAAWLGIDVIGLMKGNVQDEPASRTQEIGSSFFDNYTFSNYYY